MSYILQGSGALLGPCLGNLLGREVSRHAPCICIRCAQLLSTAQQQATAVAHLRPPTAAESVAEAARTNRQFFHHAQSVASASLAQRYQANENGSLAQQHGPLGGDELRRRFPSAAFHQKYFTNFSAPLPLLGQAGPINVNLTFLCDPGVSHTGTGTEAF
jgi:hypothetical protein